MWRWWELVNTCNSVDNRNLVLKKTPNVVFENDHCYFRKRRSSHLQIEVFKGHGVFFQEVQGVLGNKTHPEEAAVVL